MKLLAVSTAPAGVTDVNSPGYLLYSFGFKKLPCVSNAEDA